MESACGRVAGGLDTDVIAPAGVAASTVVAPTQSTIIITKVAISTLILFFAELITNTPYKIINYLFYYIIPQNNMSIFFRQHISAATVSPAGSVGASALKRRGVHRTPAPFTQRRQKSVMFL